MPTFERWLMLQIPNGMNTRPTSTEIIPCQPSLGTAARSDWWRSLQWSKQKRLSQNFVSRQSVLPKKFQPWNHVVNCLSVEVPMLSWRRAALNTICFAFPSAGEHVSRFTAVTSCGTPLFAPFFVVTFVTFGRAVGCSTTCVAAECKVRSARSCLTCLMFHNVSFHLIKSWNTLPLRIYQSHASAFQDLDAHFVVLNRSLSGGQLLNDMCSGGMQGAVCTVMPDVFDVLQRIFPSHQVMECFASPHLPVLCLGISGPRCTLRCTQSATLDYKQSSYDTV